MIAIAFLAGVLTIISPCILPVLPFVLARADQPFSRSGPPMLIGMAATFAIVASLAAVGGAWAVHANEIGRGVALVLLAVFGVCLLLPQVSALLARPVISLGETLSYRANRKDGGLGASVLLGVATGLLWAPCAGPILGLVLTGAALNGANVQTTLLLAAYAAGAAVSLALAMLAGGRVFATLKRSPGAGEHIRKALGAAVIASVVVIALGFDTGLLARLSYSSTTGIEQALLNTLGYGNTQASDPEPGRNTAFFSNEAQAGSYHSALPILGRAPSLEGAVVWLNSEPLTAEQLRGKVVLVDFWTYSCINCTRTLPYVRAWAEKYADQGLVVIGVHAPEFAFEKRIENVSRAIQDRQINYPVAVDNDFQIWRAFNNRFWPAHYFIDAQGRIRYQHFGEGDYERSEQVIQELIAEAQGVRGAGEIYVAPAIVGAEAPADLSRLRSGETYIGYLRAANFASPERLRADQPSDYTISRPRLNQWGLIGNWTVGGEYAALNEAGGAIVYRFSARDVNLVLGPAADGKPIRFKVTIDGQPPAQDHGADIDSEGYGTVTEPRLYQLVRQTNEVQERTFEIFFLDAGAQAFAFTFG